MRAAQHVQRLALQEALGPLLQLACPSLAPANRHASQASSPAHGSKSCLNNPVDWCGVNHESAHAKTTNLYNIGVRTVQRV